MFDIVVGIDPGKSGGMAYIDMRDNSYAAIKMPDTERDIIDELRTLLSIGKPVVYLEKVHSMPKQGVKSSFTFGQGYGFLRGSILGNEVRLENVRPQTWQKCLGCMSKGDKNVTKAKAQELFPDLKITHAIADALLIAEFGKRAEALNQQFTSSP